MTPLSPALTQSFAVAAAELGFCSAAWLFTEAVAAEGGDAKVRVLRDLLGRTYPVLDAVCVAWLAGERKARTEPGAVCNALQGAKAVIVVGFESLFLDALLPTLRDKAIHLLVQSRVDSEAWDRILSNYDHRVRSLDLIDVQRLAGSQTAILCLLYGANEHSVHVPPAWLRLFGDDVRAQYRSFIGWDVLHQPMYVYPRWLIEVPRSDFTRIV
ncbi:MAG: hypothetical protein JNJ46_23200 [Myxococcales bacterium]|nr:hypothetical protein [Myxococcales bacterium]